ncbi:MAG: CHASE2 domain-containing protein [Desulfobacterales bacterium]|nr:CHASE2 domain-containing protein [Desulfobacterales bacterium]
MLINYLGRPGPFPTIPSPIFCRRCSAGNLPRQDCSVGATAIGIYDLRVTPFSSTFPGVEIHATVIDNILHRNFSDPFFCSPALWIFARLYFSAWSIGLLIPRLRPVSGMMAALLIIAAFVVVNFFVFFQFNIWMNLVYPFLTNGSHLSGHHNLPILQRRTGEEKNTRGISVLSDRLGHQ